jgi:choline-glycine betaine transporter
MLWLAYRYGDIRLGPQDSTPEFTDITYFAMLFSAGIGVGLFFYGVSEPLWHQSSHWFANAGYRSQDEIDMFAMNLTVFHWGITGWSQYLVVAVCCGLASYRFNLPMTLRSCFYPLLGEYTWGWIGDVIDGFTIVTTVAGVCTSLGLGAFQIAAGLQRVGAIDDDLSEDKMRNVHVISIWVITLIATCSVVSGLNVGIKYLSQLGFGLGMVLLFLVLVMEKTNYILNLIVQVRKDDVLFCGFCLLYPYLLIAHFVDLGYS